MKTLLAPSRITFEQLPNSIAVGYVRYNDPSMKTRPRTKRISPDVNVDFDENGAVLGIELVGLDADSMAVAAGFAREHGLGFPRDLSGAATEPA